MFYALQTSMEQPGVSGHSPHTVPGRSSWGGLNVAYEMQQDPNKPGSVQYINVK